MFMNQNPQNSFKVAHISFNNDLVTMSKGINELHYETTIEECTKLGGVVISKSSITTLIVTLGDQGVLLFQKGQTKGQHFAVTPEKNVVSVIMILCIEDVCQMSGLKAHF